MLDKLERLQNVCIRFIFGLRKFDHVSHYRALLTLLPIRSRRNLHALLLLFSILYYPQTPPYLKERFNFLGSNVQSFLRAKDDNRVHVPSSRSMAYGNSFTVKVFYFIGLKDLATGGLIAIDRIGRIKDAATPSPVYSLSSIGKISEEDSGREGLVTTVF
ncbi:jg20195 [Pararge aegeria aegeria]|uniref:Jg20195 protein n=1 Tax=Pararge aegeria aegeria TaxID=348720 RepID=A0A8S4S398_9NEOP|nr:jg20195 [Pararge aegeria aegeria]